MDGRILALLWPVTGHMAGIWYLKVAEVFGGRQLAFIQGVANLSFREKKCVPIWS